MYELNKLIEKRSKLFASLKENNFDLESILAGLYNDPSHFIYEILQNAEDAFASEITFNLYEDYLEVNHNGKDFNFTDVDGITGIGISTKKDDLNSIGKFGVGFKSVFAITQTPIIHSGIYHFRITDFVIPTIVESSNTNYTKIILEFNHPLRKKNDVYEIVSKKLESIGLKTLLFLKNIQEIKWKTPSKSGHYYKTAKAYENYNNVLKVSIIAKVELNEQFEEYLIFSKPLEYDNDSLKVEIAFRLEKDISGKEKIIKEENSKLIVFFPTEKVTHLNFLIQGPYKTTPNRENIPLADEQNKLIVHETSNLVADSILIIKEIGLMDASFLEVLPIKKEYSYDPIYLQIYSKVKERLLSEYDLFPTSNNNYSSASKMLLARGKDLTEFLNNDDLSTLFSKNFWLDANITYDRTRELRDYLINEIGIKEVDFESFAKKIDYNFICNKTDEWLINFYTKLIGQSSLWKKDYINNGVLRHKPIIRLSDNSHIEPFDINDKIQVYLPTESKSAYKTVKQTIVDNKNALKYLTELGLKEPDIFAEIKEFVLPKYKADNVNVDLEEYLNDIKKLLIISQKELSTQKNEIISELKKLPIILINFDNSEKLCKPSQVYFPSIELIEYFKGYNAVNFISDNLLKLSDETTLKNFLHLIGCSFTPKRMQIKSSLTQEEKYRIHKYGHTRDKSEIDYDYEGLDNLVLNVSKDRSSLLWNLLIESLKEDKYWNFFNGVYVWYYRTDKTANFDSKFLKTLKNTSWLYDKNNYLVKSAEISFYELADFYNTENDKIDYLKKALSFKLDEIAIIEQKTGGKFIPKEQFEKFEEFCKTESEKQKDENINNEWKPEIEPENVSPIVENKEPEIINTTELGGQTPNDETPKAERTDEDTITNDNAEEDNKITIKDKKKIGNWGEKLVYEKLKKDYNSQTNIKIIWLNEYSDSGKGYDIIIKDQEEEISYIEVKSKTGDAKELILISGTQWEFARKLYENNFGNKYKIYVVSNTGSTEARITIITNPTKLWKEGKLYAHPISFKL